MRPKLMVTIGVLTLVVAIVAVFATGNGQRLFPFLFDSTDDSMAVQDYSIGNGVTVTGEHVPSGIKSDLPPNGEELTAGVVPAFGEYLSPTLDITPSGPLLSPVEMTFALPTPVTPEDAAFVMVSPDGSPDSWEAIQAEILPDQMHVRIVAEHFSYYRVYTPRAAQTAREMTDEVYGRVNNQADVPDPTSGVTHPECQNSDQALADGYVFDSSDKDTVLWCVGVNDDDVRELKVTNNRSYPFEIHGDGMVVTSNGGNLYDLTSLANLGADIVLPGRTALLEINDISVGSRATAWTQLSDAAVGLMIAQVIVDVVVTKYTKGLAKAADAESLKRRLLESFNLTECVAGASDKNFASMLVECFKEGIVTELFGKVWWKVFDVVSIVTSAYDAAKAAFNAIGDAANGRGEYRIVATRQGGLDRFVGQWERFESVYDIRADGTAGYSIGYGYGGCEDPDLACTLRTEQVLEVQDDGTLLANYTDVWFDMTDGTTVERIELSELPPGYTVDSPAIGEVVALSIDQNGALVTQVVVLRNGSPVDDDDLRQQLTSVWCNEDTARAAREEFCD